MKKIKKKSKRKIIPTGTYSATVDKIKVLKSGQLVLFFKDIVKHKVPKS